ncbi:MAG: thiamine pyrophosphate-dependent dehydrogenase E1 component subunit alpha, partial [Alphaproteobacteria bacterium]|nr:thiamine pyrophosphate-dependent dehydrogenase E1 component subunit alpha [Alphaproteobacteria bacterium]
IYPSDKIKSPIHLSIGQESISVGVCDVLRPDDLVSITYRGHAAYLAKGGSLKGMIAEMYGKKDGCCRGKGGSMHLVDTASGVIGASAVVGTTIPVAAGHALAIRKLGRDAVVACFFGDGATEEGAFTETLNFAALHRLPILFVCENNGLAIHTKQGTRWASERLCERVETYGIPAHRIQDGDVFRIRERAAAAAASMRVGGGPVLLECMTYRWREHVGPAEDYDAGYRTRDELAPWQERDAVPAVGALLDAPTRDAIDAEVEALVAEAVAFAENSPFPDECELNDHVFAD